MSELKPCPICGGKPHMYSEKRPEQHGFIHLCEIDGEVMIKIESRLFSTEDQAISAWNRRADPENPPLTLEQLRGMVGEPVWIGENGNLSCRVILKRETWPSPSAIHFQFTDGTMVFENDIGKTWIPFARKPQGPEK